MNGIDLSYHNGNIDFLAVKAAGVQFVVLRAGYGREVSQKDKKFEEYYAGAKSVGLPVGAYWYSYADSEDDAKREANACISALNGKQFEYPIFYDIEDKSMANFSKDTITNIGITFCDILEKNNYFVGIYANTDWWINRIDQSRTSRFSRWLADYRANPNTTIPRDILQYSSSGSIQGITSRVDLNTSYKDFAAIIIGSGKNGFSGSTPSPGPSNPTYDYKPGEYTVVVNKLNVRTGPGTNYPIKPLSSLTQQARAQGGYVKNVVFTASKVINNPGESWAQTPSGWVCIRNNDGEYAVVGDQSVKYNYTPGDYRVTADKLNVRIGPSTSYRIKSINELTASAKAQGGYVNGVVFTASRVVNNPGQSWAQTPSGWVCIRNNDGIYAQKI